MKPIFTLLFFFYSFHLSAQIGSATPYTWINGSNTTNQPGTYGIQGIPDPINTPPAREASVNWTDANGNMWLFGGDAGNGLTVYNLYNDLWKFDPSINQWTWMKGSNTTNQKGTYGTQGISASTNGPGARQFSVCWKDGNGNLWVFGGSGFGATSSRGTLNDLWKFDLLSNQWTWIKGSNTTNQKGVYGIKGTGSSITTPGARYGANSWTDNKGNFWLFGGIGMGASAFGPLNDLWKFDPTSNQWTWISGSTATSQPTIYGTKGIASITNTPGGRNKSASWTDANGNLWLFGGLSGFSPGYLNDLWEYDISTDQWKWISGSNTIDQGGTYGTKGTGSSNNFPGGRMGMAAWTDANGNMWLFGGDGWDGASTIGYLNDIWKFDPVSDQWTWIKGSNSINQQGTYGIQGIADPFNTPSARAYSAVWTSGTNYWFFGGNKSGTYLNDLWSISIIIPLPVKLISFNAFNNDKGVRLQWTTAEEQNSSHFIIERSADGMNYNSIGSITAKGISSSPVTYLFNDLNPVSGINYYRLKQVDKDNSFEYSQVKKVNQYHSSLQVSVKENPFRSVIHTSIYSEKEERIIITLFDNSGRQVSKTEKDMFPGLNNISIDASNVSNGVYYFHIQSDKEQVIRIVKS